MKTPRSITYFTGDMTRKSYDLITTSTYIGIDTETDGLSFVDHKLRLIQFSNEQKDVILVHHPEVAAPFLNKLLKTNKHTFIAHNIAFDYSFIKAHFNIELKKVECTKTLSKMIFPSAKSGLASALRDNFQITLDKNIDHFNWKNNKLTERQIEYASLDTIWLHPLYEALLASATEIIKLNYEFALSAITQKSALEVQGYTDLFNHQQESYKKTEKNKTFWRKRLLQIEKEFNKNKDFSLQSSSL